MNIEPNSADTKSRKKFSLNKKKFKYGSIAMTITILFIAAIVVLNLIAGILTDRKGLKIDLTEGKYYEVSDQTVKFLKKIDQDVEIAVMGNESNFEKGTAYSKMVVELLERYRQNSPRITVEFYDIASNPDVVSKFSQNYSGNIEEGNIIVSCENRVKVFTVDDLFTIESNGYSSGITGFNGEQILTSAIMGITDVDPQRVAFIAGYNGNAVYSSIIEPGVSSLYSMLNQNGYEIALIDIFADGLSPDDYDMVVLPAPMTDLSEDCIKKLEDFLYNEGNLDKNMIYMADIYQYKTPNVDDFLEVWGIEIGESWVCESDESAAQNVQVQLGKQNYTAQSPVASIADEAYGDLSNTRLPIVAPRVRPIDLLFDANVDRTTKALLKTSDTTCLYPTEIEEAPEYDLESIFGNMGEPEEETQAATEPEPTEEPTEFDIDAAEKSEQVVMALAAKTNVDDGNQQHVNNLLVIGGSGITDPKVTSSDLYNNAEFVINAVNQICGKENAIIIADKDISVNYIDVTAAQSRMIRRFVFAIPFIVVAAGLIVYLRRRNR